MRYLLILTLMLISVNLNATCNFKTDVKKVDGIYHMSKDCYDLLGKVAKTKVILSKELTLANKAKEEYKKANEQLKETINLQQKEIDLADLRADKWRETAFSVEDNAQKLYKWKKYSDWYYFGLGFLASSLSVYLASEFVK
jgi:hypothetical protein